MKNAKKPEQKRISFVHNSGKASADGVITVYMALILVIILVLLFTVTEAARVGAARSKLLGISYLGLDSVFSEFALPVFEEYGVMMLWCKDEEFVRRFDGYVEENLKTGIPELPVAADLFRISHEETTLGEVKKAVDDNGALFEEQVYEYMKYYLAESAAEKLLKDADLFEQAEKLNGFSKKLDKHRKTFTAVEESVGRIKEKTDRLQADSSDPEKYLGKMSGALDKYERTGDEAFLGDLYVNENELIASRYKIGDALEGLESETEIYHRNAQKAKDALTEIEEGLMVEKEGMPDDIYQCIEEEVEDLRQKAGDSEADFYKIEENIQKIEDCKEKIGTLDELFAALDTDITEENAPSLNQTVKAYEERFRGFDLHDLTVNYDNSRTEKESSAFLGTISGILDKGVLGYVAEDISEKKADLSEVPSKADKKSDGKRETILRTAISKAFFTEYIKGHFGNYTKTKEDKAFDYEVEYILSGKSSDRENLRSVVDRLVLIRTGFNLISLFKDAKKKTEAYALATAIIGFTGMPVLIKIMQLLILSAWAAGEAITDVKTLCRGDKVPLIKRSDEWNLSLEGIKNFSVNKAEGKGSAKGLDYEDHLRVLLLLQDRQEQVERTMDMIQLNMQKNENADFKIRDCIMEAGVVASYSVPPLFVRIPFVAANVGIGGNYEMHIEQSYGY